MAAKNKVDMTELRKAVRKVFAYQAPPQPNNPALKERPSKEYRDGQKESR